MGLEQSNKYSNFLPHKLIIVSIEVCRKHTVEFKVFEEQAVIVEAFENNKS